MCGVAGFISKEELKYQDILTSMIQKMNHRGPDSNGIYYNNNLKVGLGHARLSIIDLSETGHQPMQSHCERYKMVFNGEIYNHLEIRSKIEKQSKVVWRGTSDTETILVAIQNWGLLTTIKELVGMFAIVLLDEKEDKLYLIRDRMGEKPIYYGNVNNNFVFCSELKSISSFPDFENPINRNALALYLKYSSIPSPYSIYDNIYKLEPGKILKYDIKVGDYSITDYWSLTEKINSNNTRNFKGSFEDAVDELDNILTESVKLQMQADVPLGAFLSGGIDSSLVVALMQKESVNKVNSFSIGFEQKEYNEAEYAAEVAKHLGTNHHNVYLNNKQVLDIVPEVSKIYSEPFSDSSLVPTYLVSKIAKEKVTVSLTGDAGDELFGGYTRYQLANNSWNKVSKLPSFLKRGVSSTLTNTPLKILELLTCPVGKRFDSTGKKINVTDRILKIAPLLKIDKRKEFYHLGFMSHNLDVLDWVKNSEPIETFFDRDTLSLDSYFSEMMGSDLMTYLHNNNLTKVDRAAMANSLETRVPFLDHRVVEFALSLPIDFKIKNGVGKKVLRNVLYKYVPQRMIERPKMGFGVPLAEWLRGPLREWGENLLNAKRLREEGFFDVDIVRKKWDEHISEKRNWENQLWDVMIFQSWLDEHKNK